MAEAPEPDHVIAAVRAWTTLAKPSKKKRQPGSGSRRTDATENPPVVLVFDTETTVDQYQSLKFGVCRIYARPDSPQDVSGAADWRDYLLIGETLFHSDDLAEVDPEGFAVLKAFRAANRRVTVLPLTDFNNAVFMPLAYDSRALVVGFNLPFDISRLAVDASRARGRFQGGFSFPLATYLADDGSRREDKNKPRIRVKALNSKQAFVDFTKPVKTDWVGKLPDPGEPRRRYYSFKGHFLDLRTLAFALTGRSLSLRSACDLFETDIKKAPDPTHGTINPEYIEYARQDVRATWALYCKLREEYELHPIKLAVTIAYSAASIVKAYPEAMGIKPPLTKNPDFPNDVLGAAMVSYYGGRAECRIRRHPVPVVYTDFLSMYPTVNALMDNWTLLTADRLETEDATDEVGDFLEKITLDDVFSPDTWKQLNVLVLIAPDDDVLPVRAKYGGGSEWQIGLNPVTSAVPTWYTLADVLASKLLTRRTPKVLEAVRIVPLGRQKGLRHLKLRGQVSVDPTTDDLFRHVIELRKGELSKDGSLEAGRLSEFLKLLANSTSYGIFAEMNPRYPTRKKPLNVNVFAVGHSVLEVAHPEDPGRWCFPPLAAFIAGGARFMLALLERCVSDFGGTYAFCDTDSMAIVADESGGLIDCPGGKERPGDGSEAIQALSSDQVDRIVERFTTLNPYDRKSVGGSILEVEEENFLSKPRERAQLWCYSISAKRYVLFNRTDKGVPQFRKVSEHGLGHLLDPVNGEADPDLPDDDADDSIDGSERAWVRQIWETLVNEALSLPYDQPTWLDTPALSRFSVSTITLFKRFKNANDGKAYGERIKPFNFILIAHEDSFGLRRTTPIAPFETDPAKWIDLNWLDLRTGKRCRISTSGTFGGTKAVRVQTYADVLARYGVHPESKSLGPDGLECGRRTVGLLQRRPVTTGQPRLIGKESNQLEEQTAGLVSNADEVIQNNDDQWDLMLDVLRTLSNRKRELATGRPKRTVQSWLQEIDPPRPGKRQRQLVSDRVALWMRKELADEAPEVSVMSDVDVLFEHVARHERAAIDCQSPQNGDLSQDNESVTQS